MKQVLLLLCLLLCGSPFFLWAQNNVMVKGKVTNAAGEPVVGATVNLAGRAATTLTKSDGSYEINAAGGDELVFSHVGYDIKREKIDGRAEINVTLMEASKNLDDVVVIGYGTQKRKDLTGSVSSVSGTELAKVPVQNAGQALQGRLAGVQVTMNDGSPGADPVMKVRSGTSISQSNQPLYVVDGVPQTEGLAFLDPMDIESIDVLKDASAIAIYGARGGNGVVMVTTKQIKAGKIKINYDGYVGAKKITKEIPVMNAYQYLLLDWERAADSTQRANFVNKYGSFDSLQILYGNRPGINWQDVTFGSTVFNQYHKISMSGGSKDTKINFFLSRNKDEGIMINSGAVKNIGKLTVNQKVGEKLTVNAILNYSNQKVEGLAPTEGGNARLSVLQTILQYRPVAGRNATDESLMDLETDPYDDPASPAFQSPVVGARSRKRERVINALNANTSIQYKFTKNLTYLGLVGYTIKDNKYKQFNTFESIQAIRSGGPFGSITQAKEARFTYSNTLTYSKTFAGAHKVDVMGGQEYQYGYYEDFGASATAFPLANNGWDNLSLGTILGVPTSYAEEDKLLSFFGRINYGYKDRYMLTTTMRADGSSKFGPNNRWGYFPSAAFAWRVINENFMKNVSTLSDLKLRLGYGFTGNNRIANYAALGIYATGSYPLNNATVISAYQNNLPNPDLKWEATEGRNVGIDLGFLNQRVTLTADYYDNRSKKLLFNARIPSSSGFVTQFQNIGSTSSSGLEFMLNTTNIKRADFSWSTSFNISFPKTKVLELSSDETFKILPSYAFSSSPMINDYILQVGGPVGQMYGYVTDGLYQVSDFDYNAATNTYTLKTGVVQDNRTVQPGYQKFKDISGPGGVPDGKITDADRTIIGNANPKYTGGLNNTVSYKGFDLSVFVNFTVGNDIYNANVLNNSALSGQYKSSLARFVDRWTTIDPATGVRVTDPAALETLNKGKTIPSYIGIVSDRPYNTFIEDGSFLRLNNISLGYTLPKLLLQKAKISNARVYITAYNLHVFTKYSGYDPEVSVVNNPLTPGVDFSAYPRARSFVAGINLSL